MANHVDLYGGFTGTETSLAQRGVVDAAATVLTGDSDSSGTLSAGDAYHVVVGAIARLDGVTITGGNAVGRDGGGIYNTTSGSELMLFNVRIVANHAERDGGGVYNTRTLIVQNSIIEKNTSNHGAGVFSEGGTVTIKNSAVRGNTAATSGGGLYLISTVFDFRHGIIDGNSAAEYGGGLYLFNLAATLLNSQFSNNSADWGGAGIYDTVSWVTVSQSQFVANNAWQGGVGAIEVSSAQLKVRNSSFWGNLGGLDLDVNFFGPSDVSVFATCTQTNFSSYGQNNSTATTTPFSIRAASGQYFSDPAHGCSNWGDAATATTVFDTTDTAWENWSSEISGEVVEGTTAGVAAGVLYHPEDAWIRTFDVTAASLSWLTNAGAESCWLSNDANSTVVQVGSTELPSGSQPHALPSGTVVTMTCQSERSYPKSARATVP